MKTKLKVKRIRCKADPSGTHLNRGINAYCSISDIEWYKKMARAERMSPSALIRRTLHNCRLATTGG